MKTVIKIIIGDFPIRAKSISVNEEGDILILAENGKDTQLVDPVYIDKIVIEQEQETSLGLRYVNDEIGYVDRDEEYY